MRRLNGLAEKGKRCPLRLWQLLWTWLLICTFAAEGTCKQQLPRWHAASKAKTAQVNTADGVYEAGGSAENVAELFWSRFQPILTNNATLVNETMGFLATAPERMQEELTLAWETRLSRNAVRVARNLGNMGPVQCLRLLQSFSTFLTRSALRKHSSCMPVVRRLTVASIIRLSIQWGKELWTDEFQQAVRAVILALFRLHRHGAAGKGALEFFHVSKAGGTSMCQLSILNGCNASDTTLYGNCLMRRFNDGPRWVSHKAHAQIMALTSTEQLRWFYRYHSPRGNKPCAVRHAALARANITFLSNEFAAHGGVNSTRHLHVCRDTFNVILFREPHARLASNIKWIMYVYRHVYQDGWERFFLNRTAEWWYNFAPAIADNYYTRVLGGEHTFYLPRGAVPRSAQGTAKLLVLQYDAVLQLEAPDVNRHLQFGLGWVRGMDDIASRHNRGGWGRVNAAMPPDMDHFHASGDLDRGLYQFASFMHQLDSFMYDVAAAAGEQPLPHWQQLLQDSGTDLAHSQPRNAALKAAGAIGSAALAASSASGGKRSTQRVDSRKMQVAALPDRAESKPASTSAIIQPDTGASATTSRSSRHCLAAHQDQGRGQHAVRASSKLQSSPQRSQGNVRDAGLQLLGAPGGDGNEKWQGLGEEGDDGGPLEGSGEEQQDEDEKEKGRASPAQAPRTQFASRLQCGYVGLSQEETKSSLMALTGEAGAPVADAALTAAPAGSA